MTNNPNFHLLFGIDHDETSMTYSVFGGVVVKYSDNTFGPMGDYDEHGEDEMYCYQVRGELVLFLDVEMGISLDNKHVSDPMVTRIWGNCAALITS